MFSFLRAFGQSFGVAVGGIVFQNALIKQFAKYPGLDELIAGGAAKDAVALVQYIKALPKGDPTRINLVQSYADALKPVWLAMMAFGIVGLVASVAVEGLSLDRVLVTDQGIREKKKQSEEGDA
jgi:hypothetical protein